jgi:predicted NAD-dependent protein-ADP-ribosyltransferase YbiA (DUF1768 family)
MAETFRLRTPVQRRILAHHKPGQGGGLGRRFRPPARPLWHTGLVARGWESKSVEEQIELAREKDVRASPRVAPQQGRRLRERDDLELARNRVLQELAHAKHPRHRQLLEAALSHLDNKIATLDEKG